MIFLSFSDRNESSQDLQKQKDFYVNELLSRDKMISELELLSKENSFYQLETSQELENLKLNYQKELQLQEAQSLQDFIKLKESFQIVSKHWQMKVSKLSKEHHLVRTEMIELLEKTKENMMHEFAFLFQQIFDKQNNLFAKKLLEVE